MSGTIHNGLGDALPFNDPAAPAGPRIAHALGAVMRSIRPIGKDRENQAQRFNFRGIDDLYNELHDKLAEHSVLTLPHVVSADYSDRVGRNSSGKDSVQTHVRLVIDYEFYCTLDGSSKTIRLCSEALDTSDKATNKALSFAHKYALIQAFAIPTESYEDAGETGVADGDRDHVEAGRTRAQPARQADTTAKKKPTENASTVTMLQCFALLGVSQAEIVEKLQCRHIDRMNANQVEWLRTVYLTVTSGKKPIEFFFPKPAAQTVQKAPDEAPRATSVADELNEKFGG